MIERTSRATSPGNGTVRAADPNVRAAAGNGAPWRHRAAVLAIAGAAMLWAWRTQQVQIFRYWDADEYFLMAEQLAADATVTAAAPYAYRLLTPWLVAQCCAADIQRGFLLVNLAAGTFTALLLDAWLHRFGIRAAVRLTLVSAYAVHWLGPLRLTFFYPAYVDPVFHALFLTALLVGHGRTEPLAASRGAIYALVVSLGTLAREAMLVAPAAAAVAAWARHGLRRAAWPLAALAGGVLVLGLVRAGTAPRAGFTFGGAVLQQLARKPVESALLAWFLAFGPMLAVIVFDWRATARWLREHGDLALVLAGCFGLAYVGGQDTERLLFWAMPVVFLLVAQSIERQYRALSPAAILLLVVGQLLAARVFWPMPSPTSDPVPLTDLDGLGARVHAVLNRVFVIDDFYWNLWSNFGSRPFHAVQLVFHLALTGAIVGLMRRRAVGHARGSP